MKKIIYFFALSLFIFSLSAEAHVSSEAHQDLITNIVTIKNNHGETSYFTTAEDGFIIKWDEDNEGEHYQISDVGIKLMAVSPDGNYVAAYESDGGAVNKVTVWDWSTHSRKYQKKLSDSVTSLSFSSKGNYLIIGTATVEGVIFVKTGTWNVVNKLKANTSIVNYIHTSESEKTCVFYSPAGSLSYYNLQTGQLKEKFDIVRALSQTVMYNNNIFLAGVRDDHIYIVNAFKGNTIASIPAHSPLILSNSMDYNLYYLEYDGRNSYELKMLETMENNTVSNPRIVKSMKGPRSNAAICVGAKQNGDIYLGGRNGALYRTDVEPTVTTENLTEFTQNQYTNIVDVCPVDDDFYFLTSKSLYRSSYENGFVKNVCSTDGENQIINIGNNQIVLWSKSTRKAVSLLNIESKNKTSLFVPKSNLQTLKLCNVGDKQYLVAIESNTVVSLYDFTNKSLKQIYTGSGIQDAILTDNGYVYIAKSITENSQNPLLSVNPETLETVPVTNVKGKVAFALSTDGKIIYGINLVSDDTGSTTYVFSFNTATKVVTNKLKFANEDSEAFTYLNKNNLYTNIGKSVVYCLNLSTNKRFNYNRSASIPGNICQNGDRVVILNRNGSISWCNSNSSKLLADLYLTNDERWREF